MPDGGRLAQGPVLPAIGRLAVGAGLPAKSRLVLHRAVCLLALCLALSSPAFAVVLPPAVAAQHPEFDRVGGGEMRWLGFKLYDAALWASARGEAAMGDAHVLSIRYSRAIGSERLVAVSLDEMRRLGFGDEVRLARWGEALAAALPSVEAGDTLAALHRPGEGARLSTMDGLRVDWPDGWGLVRASNTTPILVMRFDADTNAGMARIQQAFREQLHQVEPDLSVPF